MSSYTPIESDAPAYTENNTQSAPNTANNNSSQTAQPLSTNPNDWSWYRKLQESSHPLALFFFIFFRLSPIFMYIFGTLVIGIFTSDGKFILHFISIVLLVSADFWNLKNIAGRLLVGLRWWNETNLVEGSTSGEVENVWVFETSNPDRYINPIDSKVFWLLLYVQPVSWCVLGIFAVLKFQFLYLLLIVIATSLSVTNAMAFTKCDKFGKANGIATDLFSRATSSAFSRLNPFA
ncbi:golgi apparatus membrane protein Tvp23p [[Candida] railenensis]|uniref:Golgi apparatus membrane protein TVP23 n=1 Tax=[Candida] railenensis TaxID=45579 RepID=A0A9P0QMB4_9ASCO|nr:golgi apparatus membrane protein Tvp23p [[Candida] railenensis]